MSVLVKVCGIKNANEAQAICGVKFNGKSVDFIGVILAKSPRQVSQSLANDIAQIAHKNGVKAVGVYDWVNLDEILKSALEAKFDAVQIYTPASSTEFEKFSQNGIKLWLAQSVGDTKPKHPKNCDLALYDTKGAKLGGNGISFDWTLLNEIEFEFGIAGGLGTHNAAKAMQSGVVLLDFNSKLENENMQKDPQKIYEILQITKE